MKSVTPVRTEFLFAASLVILLLGNQSFFYQVLQIYPFSVKNLGFLISILVVLSSVLILLAGIFSLLLGRRAGLSLLFLVTAICAHFIDTYGVMFDVNMIRNVFETDVAESSDLMTWVLLVKVCLFFLIPCLAVWLVPLEQLAFLSKLKKFLLLAMVAILATVLAGAVYKTEYAVFIRNHKSVRYFVNPVTALYSTFRYAQEKWGASVDQTYVRKTTTAQVIEGSPHYELIVVVVGETARADHFSLNGYARETNPLLQKEQRLLSYTSVSSCGTSTAISVPCMFSLEPKDDFDINSASRTENILDVLQSASVNVLWRDNNSNSKGVAERIPYQNYRAPSTNGSCDDECRDVGMLEGLQNYVDTHPGDVLIVLHQMGSHGPAYYKRYPPEFEKFVPTCQTSELEDCTPEEITNAYDNSILYTDYFLSKTIQWLKSNDGVYEPILLYISDHGESLGENGIYLHGLPYLLAPSAQTNVPLIAWIGEHSDVDYEKSRTLLTHPHSHDAISRTLAEVFEVESDFNLEKSGPLIYLLPEDE